MNWKIEVAVSVLSLHATCARMHCLSHRTLSCDHAWNKVCSRRSRFLSGCHFTRRRLIPALWLALVSYFNEASWARTASCEMQQLTHSPDLLLQVLHPVTVQSGWYHSPGALDPVVQAKELWIAAPLACNDCWGLPRGCGRKLCQPTIFQVHEWSESFASRPLPIQVAPPKEKPSLAALGQGGANPVQKWRQNGRS